VCLGVCAAQWVQDACHGCHSALPDKLAMRRPPGVYGPRLPFHVMIAVLVPVGQQIACAVVRLYTDSDSGIDKDDCVLPVIERWEAFGRRPERISWKRMKRLSCSRRIKRKQKQKTIRRYTSYLLEQSSSRTSPVCVCGWPCSLRIDGTRWYAPW
jgi:hypothetical protein